MRFLICSLLALTSLSFQPVISESSNEFSLLVVFNDGFRNNEPVEIVLTNNHVKEKIILSEKLEREAEELGTNLYLFKLPKNEYNSLTIKFIGREKEIHQTLNFTKLEEVFLEISASENNQFRTIIFDNFTGGYD